MAITATRRLDRCRPHGRADGRFILKAGYPLSVIRAPQRARQKLVALGAREGPERGGMCTSRGW